jgi:hypothetical protein
VAAVAVAVETRTNQQTEFPSHVKHARVASQPTGWIAFTEEGAGIHMVDTRRQLVKVT